MTVAKFYKGRYCARGNDLVGERGVEPSMRKSVNQSNRAVAPSEAERLLARETRRKIGDRVAAGADLRLVIYDQSGRQTLALPPLAMRLVLDLLDVLASGSAVAMTELKSDLTSNQAADLMGISRSALLQLLESGAIPFHRIGTHRRIPLQYALDFKAKNMVAQPPTDVGTSK